MRCWNCPQIQNGNSTAFWQVRAIAGIERAHQRLAHRGQLGDRRLVLPSADLADFFADSEERLDDARVPLRARAFAQNQVEAMLVHAFSVRSIAGHRVVGIGHCDDTSEKWNLLAREA